MSAAMNAQVQALGDVCAPPHLSLLRSSQYQCRAITTTLHSEMMSISYDIDRGASNAICMVQLVSSLSGNSSSSPPAPRKVKLRGAALFPEDVIDIKVSSSGQSILLISMNSLHVVVLPPNYYNTKKHLSSPGDHEEEGVLISLLPEGGADGRKGHDRDSRILSASFHPLNEKAVIALTEDTLYSLVFNDPFLPGAPPASVLRESLLVVNTKANHVAFCFDAKRGWRATVLYLLYSDGSVDVVAPVVPHGAVLEASLLDDMRIELEELNCNSKFLASLLCMNE
jgi:hypothetical protein